MKSPTVRSLEVEVAYALDKRQWLRQVRLGEGATAGEAVMASGLAAEIPGLDTGTGSQPALARFGRLIAWDAPLLDGDRVDILRPLQADPKESRLRRAQGQAEKKGR